jgi:hypothetical protein
MNIKRPIYLRHAATEIWVFDVQKKVLHVQRASESVGAPLAIPLTPSASITLHALPEVQIDLAPLVEE